MKIDKKCILIVIMLVLYGCSFFPFDRYYAGSQMVDDKLCRWYIDYQDQRYCTTDKKIPLPTKKQKDFFCPSCQKCNSCEDYIKNFKSVWHQRRTGFAT